MCLDRDDIVEIEGIFETYYKKNKSSMDKEKKEFLHRLDSIFDNCCNATLEETKKDK